MRTRFNFRYICVWGARTTVNIKIHLKRFKYDTLPAWEISVFAISEYVNAYEFYMISNISVFISVKTCHGVYPEIWCSNNLNDKFKIFQVGGISECVFFMNADVKEDIVNSGFIHRLQIVINNK